MSPTRHGTFDRSRAGSFIQGLTGDRNRARRAAAPGRFVFIAWLDHATSFPLTIWAKAANVIFGVQNPVCNVTQNWTNVSDDPLAGGGGPNLHTGPYSNGAVLNQDIRALRDALAQVEAAGHDPDELFTLIAVQAESPNIFSSVTYPTRLNAPLDTGAVLQVSGTNIAGRAILGAVVDPIAHISWQEEATQYDFVDLFQNIGRPEGEGAWFASCYGRPPGGGPNFPTESIQQNRVRVLNASGRAMDLVLQDGSPPPEQIVNHFFPFVRPNAWAHRNIGAIVAAQQQRLGSASVGVGSFFGDRWYQWLAQEVARTASTLPPP